MSFLAAAGRRCSRCTAVACRHGRLRRSAGHEDQLTIFVRQFQTTRANSCAPVRFCDFRDLRGNTRRARTEGSVLANHRLQPLGHLTAARILSISACATYADAAFHKTVPEIVPITDRNEVHKRSSATSSPSHCEASGFQTAICGRQLVGTAIVQRRGDSQVQRKLSRDAAIIVPESSEQGALRVWRFSEPLRSDIPSSGHRRKSGQPAVPDSDAALLDHVPTAASPIGVDHDPPQGRSAILASFSAFARFSSSCSGLSKTTA
jgi:hypothetical protein